MSTILFSAASAQSSTGAAILGLFFLVALGVAIGARRLVFDVFRDASPSRPTKRPVPWGAEGAAIVFLCGAFLFPIGALLAIEALAPAAPTRASDAASDDAPTAESDDLATAHPLVRLLVRARSTPWGATVFFVCLVVSTIAAPLAEEFVYRVVFQGSLENVALAAVLPTSSARPSFRWNDPTPSANRRAFRLRSIAAVVVPATIFGLVHMGAPETPEEAAAPETLAVLYRATLATGVANVATLLFGAFFLRRFFRATAEDFGLGPDFSLRRGRAAATIKRTAFDFFRGIVLFLFVAPIVFGVNAALRAWAPGAIVDPVPIFVFALAEGVVYLRTRRYATVVGMHVGLNATSFFALCVQILF